MTKLIVGNQKTYLNKEEFLAFLDGMKGSVCKDVVLAPSFPYIDIAASKSKFILCAQNVSDRENGATTGEVSAEQLSSLNVKYCIVGHSERRDNQKENSDILTNKIIQLLNNNIIPIFCIGEHLDEKNDNLTKDVIGKEIMEVYNLLDSDQIEKIILAYEPIWAIGSGLTPTNDEIAETTNYIKDLIIDKYEVSSKVLYGGSVSKKNIDLLNEIDVVDGYLIGGASTKAEEFLYIMSKNSKR